MRWWVISRLVVERLREFWKERRLYLAATERFLKILGKSIVFPIMKFLRRYVRQIVKKKICDTLFWKQTAELVFKRMRSGNDGGVVQSIR